MDIQTAKEIILFATLGEEELKHVLGIAHKTSFVNGQQIIQQGQSHSSLYLVEEGVLHVSRKTEQSQVFLGRIEKGGFFGEIGLFDPGPATATVRAIAEGVVYEIRREEFEPLLDKNPVLGCKILKTMMSEMAKRLRRVDQRLADSMFWGETSTEGVQRPGQVRPR